MAASASPARCTLGSSGPRRAGGPAPPPFAPPWGARQGRKWASRRQAQPMWSQGFDSHAFECGCQHHMQGTRWEQFETNETKPRTPVAPSPLCQLVQCVRHGCVGVCPRCHVPLHLRQLTGDLGGARRGRCQGVYSASDTACHAPAHCTCSAKDITCSASDTTCSASTHISPALHRTSQPRQPAAASVLRGPGPPERPRQTDPGGRGDPESTTNRNTYAY